MKSAGEVPTKIATHSVSLACCQGKEAVCGPSKVKTVDVKVPVTATLAEEKAAAAEQVIEDEKKISTCAKYDVFVFPTEAEKIAARAEANKTAEWWKKIKDRYVISGDIKR